MSELAPIEAGMTPSPGTETKPGAEPSEACWYVRAAGEEDIPAVVAAVKALLLEIGGTPPGAEAMSSTARSLLADGDAGVLLIAEAGAALVGVLGASWQTAIHVPGRYALIQDLWVAPAWRSRAIGADLLAALSDLACGRQITRIEVGLPKEGFAGLAATEAFYRTNGFESLGQRMRWLLE